MIVTIKKGVCIHHYPVVDTNFKLKAVMNKRTGLMEISIAQLKLVSNATDTTDLGKRFAADRKTLPFNASELIIH